MTAIRRLGQRAPDDTCIPLCCGCHRNRHELQGFFEGMARDERRAWEDAQIPIMQRAYRAYQEGIDGLF